MASSDGGAFLARIVGLYVDHAPKALAELEASLAADPEDQAKAAHALKSMSFNIGAVRVAALAGACEKRVRVDGEREERTRRRSPTCASSSTRRWPPWSLIVGRTSASPPPKFDPGPGAQNRLFRPPCGGPLT